MNAIFAKPRGWAWPTGWTKSASQATVVAALMAVTLAFIPASQTSAAENESGSANPDSPSIFAEWATVEDETLADNRGGTAINLGDLGLNIASNTSTQYGNTVSGDVDTGQITANSLNDVSGINSLMFNSGNNVSFQNSMQINIFLK